LLASSEGCWFTGTVAAKYRVLNRRCAKSGLSQFTRGLSRSVRSESPRLASRSVKDFSCSATASRARIQSALEVSSTVVDRSGPASRMPVSSNSSRMAPTTWRRASPTSDVPICSAQCWGEGPSQPTASSSVASSDPPGKARTPSGEDPVR
jgi:hypothetical protein